MEPSLIQICTMVSGFNCNISGGSDCHLLLFSAVCGKLLHYICSKHKPSTCLWCKCPNISAEHLIIYILLIVYIECLRKDSYHINTIKLPIVPVGFLHIASAVYIGLLCGVQLERIGGNCVGALKWLQWYWWDILVIMCFTISMYSLNWLGMIALVPSAWQTS